MLLSTLQVGGEALLLLVEMSHCTAPVVSPQLTLTEAGLHPKLRPWGRFSDPGKVKWF